MTRPLGPSLPADRGFALLIVLWTVVLLALLSATLLGSAHTEARIATNVRGLASATAAADAAISATILDLLRPNAAAAPVQKIAAATVAVAVENYSGRINPNIASAAFLRAFLVRLGLAAAQAEHVAAAIVDWRTPGLSPSPNGAKADAYRAAGLPYGPPGKPFEHLDELGAVLGLTPPILAAMLPHLTLWSTTDPDPAFADAVVLAALRASGAPPVASAETEAQVIAITAIATLPDAPSVTRRAVVRFGYSPDGRGWRVLAWDGGDPASP